MLQLDDPPANNDEFGSISDDLSSSPPRAIIKNRTTVAFAANSAPNMTQSSFANPNFQAPSTSYSSTNTFDAWLNDHRSAAEALELASDKLERLSFQSFGKVKNSK